jgi:hypothetical protein
MRKRAVGFPTAVYMAWGHIYVILIASDLQKT